MMIVQVGALTFNAVTFHSALREDLFQRAKRDAYKVIARAKQELEKTLADDKEIRDITDAFGTDAVMTAIAACKHGIEKLGTTHNEWVHASTFVNVEGVSIIGYILHVVHHNNLIGKVIDGQHVLITANKVDGEDYYDRNDEEWSRVFHAAEQLINFRYHARDEQNPDDVRDALGFSI